MASSSGAKDDEGIVINPFEKLEVLNVIKWGDTSDLDSDESSCSVGNNSDGSELEVQETEFDTEPLGFSPETTYNLDQAKILSSIDEGSENEACECLLPVNNPSCIKLMQTMQSNELNRLTLHCLIDNIIRCYKHIFLRRTKKTLSKYKVAFVDHYFRLRHEILFKLTCLAYNLPAEKSDISFREFNIDSDRTPDLIINKDGAIHIIEVTATSGLEKAAISKGMEQMGFESKYKREIEELIDRGNTVIYSPVFFDMSNLDIPWVYDQLDDLEKLFHVNKLYMQLLKKTARDFAWLSSIIKERISTSASILFTKTERIIPSHTKHEFLYNVGCNSADYEIIYKEFVVSKNIYNKVMNNKQRLFWSLDNSKFNDITKVIFVMQGTNHRIILQKNEKEGIYIPLLREILNSGDILNLLKYFRLQVGNILIDVLDSDTGVKYYERVKKLRSKEADFNLSSDEIATLSNHNPTAFVHTKNEVNLISYLELIDKFERHNINCNIFDPDYEELYLTKLKELDENGLNNYCSLDESEVKIKLLGQLYFEEIDMEKEVGCCLDNYISINSESDNVPKIVLRDKSPFIMPIAEFNFSSYCKLEYKNEIFLNNVHDSLTDRNPYTKLILKNVLQEDYEMYSKPILGSVDYHNLLKDRSNISNQINELQKNAIKTEKLQKTVQLSKCEDPSIRESFLDLKKKYIEINKHIKSTRNRENIGQNRSYISLPTKGKNSNLRKMLDKEMGHFKLKRGKIGTIQSTIEGVGIMETIDSDYKLGFSVFESITLLLTKDMGSNPDPLMDSTVTKDAKLLMELKQKAVDDYSQICEQVKNSYLGHAAAFISRIAHTLLYLSQLPFSSNYIRVDNLGYKNVLLLVRGGKKIFKSKSSKLFRLVYPISEELLPWYTPYNSPNSSFEIMKISDTNYIITPWVMWNEKVLTDAISFYPRVTSFAILNLNPKINLRDQFNIISMNVLLSFHNRRQTEILLANLRYILLSTLGDFTGVAEILPEFFGFNYDCFQNFIRNSIIMNYPDYFNMLKKLKIEKSNDKDINESDFQNIRLCNIFTKLPISNVEELALMIYSTFLMTKAPYQKNVERANNLKGMLETDIYYKEKVGEGLMPMQQLDCISVSLTEDKSFKEYTTELFKNDFNIDPKYCANVGKFMDSYFLNQNMQDEIYSEWIKILSQNWDELATSTGLRGNNDTAENFWGRKGYFVVYKELLSNPDYSRGIKEIFTGDLSNDEKRKKMRRMNRVYIDDIDVEREYLIFHTVEKDQWRGGREIFVMDVTTKLLQQPIEKFMGYLCSKVDNELISIPSDRRAQTIHHSIFEKDIPSRDMLVWYLTLDCKKWAPKSVFVKFAILFNNMSCIPNSFKIHFMNYIEKLYNKRVYFNVSEVEVLLKNPLYKEKINNMLIKDEKVNGYYTVMNYSWVMGIFNYTSSFLHAANQKYCSYILIKSTVLSFQEEVNINMFAHSDDSGGKLTASSTEMVKRSLIIYEINLKACNHLLSKKKSTVSKIYFEILSIIYIFKKLLALLPKFLGGLRFLPTDKGPAQDMLQAYSKSIEVLVSGASFSIAYLVLKFYTMIVWRFYNSRSITEDDYNRPVQYLGVPDAHPLFILLCGSESDLIRLIYTGKDLTRLISFTNSIIDVINDNGPIKPFKFLIKVRGLSKDFQPYINEFSEIFDSWSVRNVNYHNTVMNTLNFLHKLNDPGFVGSLVNESTVRRISRSYFIRSGESAMTKLGPIKLRTMLDALTLVQNFDLPENSVSALLFDILPLEKINEIKDDYKRNLPDAELSLNLIKHTMSSPLKILKYLDNITLENKTFNFVNRTLKPTQVQLTLTPKVFSVKFDPASLVSYICEPNLNWALSNVRNLNSAKEELLSVVQNLGFEIQKLSPDNLLRLCRFYSNDSVKNIYVYSKVPGDIRQIKTYTAFLTYLSVNSFNDQEINGLTIKLSDREVSKEYLTTSVNPDLYFINNVISFLYVLVTKSNPQFVIQLRIKEITEINYKGGHVSDLLTHLKTYIDNEIGGNFLLIQLLTLQQIISSIPIQFIDNPSITYYTFLKEQRLKKGWYGKGELYIHIENYFYSFELSGSEITQVYTNKVGKLPNHHSDYIFDVLVQTGLKVTSFKKIKNPKQNEFFFGFDKPGQLAISNFREVTNGVCVTILQKRNCFIDNFYNCKVLNLYKDHLLCSFYDDGVDIKRKIYFLPLKKSDILPTIPKILFKEDFELKLMEVGLNDFEEFLLTEVMVEYGEELFVEFQTVFDNFAASRLYEIIYESKRLNMSKIPRQIGISPLPAPEGSLTRILVDYTINTNNSILKTQSNLNPTIMQLRSEYPEQMSLILSENLVKCHKNIYSGVEQKEIMDSYYTIQTNNSFEEIQGTIIKLMTHWGYGSLVNSLEKFSLVKDEQNYLYFNLILMEDSKITYFSRFFPLIVKSINKVMNEFADIYKTLDKPIPKLANVYSVEDTCNEYVLSTIMEVYGYNNNFLNYSIEVVLYHNMLLAFFFDEEFIASLQLELQSFPFFSSIIISQKYKFEFISVLNLFKMLWVKDNSNKFELSYLQKLQRMPNDIRSIKSYCNDFSLSIPPSVTYYSSFFNNNVLTLLYQNRKIKDIENNCEYNISSKLCKKSNTFVPMTEILQFKRPIKKEILEEEDWDEIKIELTMDPVDEDTVLDIWGTFENPYSQRKTKKHKVKNNLIISDEVNWIINPFRCCKSQSIGFYRQVGENIIVLTNTILTEFCKSFPNSGVRLVNYKKAINSNCRIYLAYYSFSKELNNKKFIDSYIGGVDITHISDQFESLFPNFVRDSDGIIKETHKLGQEDIIDEMRKNTKYTVVNNLIVPIESAENEVKKLLESGDDELGEILKMQLDLESNNGLSEAEMEAIQDRIKIDKIFSNIDTMGLERGLTKETRENLKSKYDYKLKNKQANLICLLRSLKTEIALISTKDKLLKNEVSLTNDQQIKMYSAPEAFGLAQNLNKFESNPIRDKKLRSEINSMSNDLSRLVGSSTFRFSKNFKKLVEANFKMFNNMVKHSQYKKENKTFLLTILLSLINSCSVCEGKNDDSIWQEILNKCTIYIADTGPDSSDDDELLDIMLDIEPQARIRYRPLGT